MTIPKLDLSKAINILDEFKSNEGLSHIIDQFREDQGTEEEIKLLLIGIINIEAARGFLVAYMLFRNSLIEEEMKSFK